MPVQNATAEIEEIVRNVAKDLSDFLPLGIEVCPFPSTGAQLTVTPKDANYGALTLTYYCFAPYNQIVIKASEGRVTEALAHRFKHALEQDHPDIETSISVIGPQSDLRAMFLAGLISTVGMPYNHA